MHRLECHVVQHVDGVVCPEGVVGLAGDIQRDHPQPPGGLVLVDLEAHPARLHRQARGGEVQPGSHLGGNLGAQQRQGGAQLRDGNVSDRPRSGGEVLAGERGGGLLDDLNIGRADMADAGGVGVG